MVDIRTVGVIGAGQMGTGIAHVCALAGYNVRLNDLTRERIDAGISLIERNLGRQVGRAVKTALDPGAAVRDPPLQPPAPREVLYPRHPRPSACRAPAPVL